LVKVTQNEIMALLHRTLEDWLAAGPSDEDKASMAMRICDLHRAVPVVNEHCLVGLVSDPPCPV